MREKRGIVFLSVMGLFLAAFTLNALDLILKNGEVLRNVTVVNIRNNGVQINADQYGNGSDIITRMVRYTELTPFSLGKLKKELDRRAQMLNQPLPFPQYPGIRTDTAANPLRAHGVRIRFDSDGMLLNGSIGWAHEISRTDPLNTYPMGRIYLYGVMIPEGGNWFGTVYPAGRSIARYNNLYECWAKTPWAAKRLSVYPFME